MPRDTDQFDFFVSYARRDNVEGWISGFIEELRTEHRRFSGGRELVPFFDLHDIRSYDDWKLRLADALAKSRLFLAFVSVDRGAAVRDQQLTLGEPPEEEVLERLEKHRPFADGRDRILDSVFSASGTANMASVTEKARRLLSEGMV